MRCPVHLTIFRTRLYFTYERLSFHMNNPPIACVNCPSVRNLPVCFASSLYGPIQSGPRDVSSNVVCTVSVHRTLFVQRPSDPMPAAMHYLFAFFSEMDRRVHLLSFWRMCLLCAYCIIRRISSVLLRFWVPTGSCMSSVPLLICDWALALHGFSTGSSMYVPPYAKPMGLRYRCIPPAGRIMSIQ